MNDYKELSIRKCPICGKSHEYNLTIEYSPVLYMLSPNDDPNKFKKKFDVYLTCPDKDSTFKATIELDTFGKDISKVHE